MPRMPFGKPKPPKPINEEEAKFARFFIVDPSHNVSAAARRCGRTPWWGHMQLKKVQVRRYIRHLSGKDADLVLAEKKKRDPLISSADTVAVREAQIMQMPGNEDVDNVFRRLRTFMDFRLVDVLTHEGPLQIDAEKIRALQGTDEGRSIKRFRHQQHEKYDKRGRRVGVTHHYEVEIESPLQAVQTMAKILGIDAGDGDENARKRIAALEKLMAILPDETLRELHLAMLEHGGQMVDGPTSNQPPVVLPIQPPPNGNGNETRRQAGAADTSSSGATLSAEDEILPQTDEAPPPE
jgi:hypothetical protein